MNNGNVKVFVALGGNFVLAAPDTQYTAAGLRNTDLTVQVSTKLNRSHLVHGKQALILPCLGRTEKDIQKSGEQGVSVRGRHEHGPHQPRPQEACLPAPEVRDRNPRRHGSGDACRNLRPPGSPTSRTTTESVT